MGRFIYSILYLYLWNFRPSSTSWKKYIHFWARKLVENKSSHRAMNRLKETVVGTSPLTSCKIMKSSVFKMEFRVRQIDLPLTLKTGRLHLEVLFGSAPLSLKAAGAARILTGIGSKGECHLYRELLTDRTVL